MEKTKKCIRCGEVLDIYAETCWMCDRVALKYEVGDTGPAGGIVFYDKGSFSDGWRYLECAPEDLGEAEWGAYKKDVSGTETGIGTGKRNTELIVAFLKQKGETGGAAQLCADYTLNGYSDWFLPSKDELNLMYTNLHKNELGGFKNKVYWSSSQYYSGHAWEQSFSNGDQSDPAKYNYIYVRCVRAF